MTFLHDFWRCLLGIKSPSVETAKKADKYLVKPLQQGIKAGEKHRNKYEADYAKFKRKWLKKNSNWIDTRQRKKAMEKAFLKEFPHYRFYIQLERLGKKCKI